MSFQLSEIQVVDNYLSAFVVFILVVGVIVVVVLSCMFKYLLLSVIAPVSGRHSWIRNCCLHFLSRLGTTDPTPESGG